MSLSWHDCATHAVSLPHMHVCASGHAQQAHDAGVLSKQTDIWALGVVLLEMLTGQEAAPGLVQHLLPLLESCNLDQLLVRLVPASFWWSLLVPADVTIPLSAGLPGPPAT